tara:strand:+ start:4644 stop:5096 length:453 start_codon:yes stop_codon:yes gene_type:complete
MAEIAINKRAKFDYEILDTCTAGLELIGHEVKSLKKRGVSLSGAHVIIRKGEAFLIGMEISSFQPGNEPENFKSGRTLRLLLKKSEISYLFGKTQSGLTIVPIKLYDNVRGKIKIDIALARGRKKHDKRELIKKREAKREIRSASRRNIK